MTKQNSDEMKSIETNSKGHERKIMGKRLSKYIAGFDYLDKNLIVLSATSGEVFNIFLQVLLKLMQEQQVQVLLLYFLWQQ